MENLISKSLLYKVKNDDIKTSSQMLFEANSARKRRRNFNETVVFLSHKHSETEIINQAITLFKSLGVKVYLDWLDSEMPTNTNGYTAKKIKERIRQCDRFVFLATEEAIKSKWCNWELGYGDSQKYHQKIAVMPITDEAGGNFSGTEYLAIYPIITSRYLTYTGTYYVEFEDKKVELSNWLK